VCPKELQMSDISGEIWDMKYRLKQADGTPVDRDLADTWARVALAAAQAEVAGKAARLGARVRRFWPGTNFLPAGRILAGAGYETATSRSSTAT
jgi:ribonucleoside-diphosphate reductase alpha chain